MTCKFCGCTDEIACHIGMKFQKEPEGLATQLSFGDGTYACIVRDRQQADFHTPCHWIDDEICSAPACVDRAYAERVKQIDQITMTFLEVAA